MWDSKGLHVSGNDPNPEGPRAFLVFSEEAIVKIC